MSLGYEPSSKPLHVSAKYFEILNPKQVNSDGDMLIVPQQRTLTLQTEFGFLQV